MELASSPNIEEGLSYLGLAITILSLFIWMIKPGSWSDRKRNWIVTLVGLAGVAVNSTGNQLQKQSAEAKEATMKLAEQLHHEQLESATQKAVSAELRASNAENKAADTEAHLEDMRRFSEVAKLTPTGHQSPAYGGMAWETAISKRMEKLVRRAGGRVIFEKGQAYERYYQELMDEFPDFPFTYFAMAFAYHDRNDIKWKDYAKKAEEILMRTTAIDHHNPVHSEALESIRALLNEGAFISNAEW